MTNTDDIDDLDEFEFTIENMRAFDRDVRDMCGCEPICPDCQGHRDVYDAIIPVILKAGAHTVEAISYLCPDPENPGHLSGAGPLIEVDSAFVGYYLKWGIQPMADLPGSLVTITADPAGPMFLNILAGNGYFVWELHKVPWWEPHAPTFLGVWPD